ncbi:MAG: ASCH domain-containing protein [Planctomycetota bacterium]
MDPASHAPHADAARRAGAAATAPDPGRIGSGGLVDPNPDRDRIALGIRQPWCELILRGRKTLEIRSRSTEVRGPIYIYASKTVSDLPELDEVLTREDLDLNVLPRGRILGSVEIVGCRRATPTDDEASCVPRRELIDRYAWELANPVRFAEPLKPRFLPYGVWFYPFKRRS